MMRYDDLKDTPRGTSEWSGINTTAYMTAIGMIKLQKVNFGMAK